jgi:hypothetical protein
MWHMVASVERVESVMENATQSALSVAENTAVVIVVVRFAHKGRDKSSISNMIY